MLKIVLGRRAFVRVRATQHMGIKGGYFLTLLLESGRKEKAAAEGRGLRAAGPLGTTRDGARARHRAKAAAKRHRPLQP